jgi:hypothetical protein
MVGLPAARPNQSGIVAGTLGRLDGAGNTSPVQCPPTCGVRTRRRLKPDDACHACPSLHGDPVVTLGIIDRDVVLCLRRWVTTPERSVEAVEVGESAAVDVQPEGQRAAPGGGTVRRKGQASRSICAR